MCIRDRCVVVLLAMDIDELRKELRVSSLTEAVGLLGVLEEMNGDVCGTGSGGLMEKASNLVFVEDAEVPEQFMCPIKCDVMDEPCTASDGHVYERFYICLLYTSDAADDLLCVDLGGRRRIKKKKNR
eukprot:TRINITY_DN23907_c0_g1_i1.p1 TRINITY_DN23907_c0_g1~~TRINITY_DN23907_c0_g1_i1.p1  ORF type:complete len:128 (+),score=55.12 TRINITY_DN23907_c0_g1_i1:122-505(+)